MNARTISIQVTNEFICGDGVFIGASGSHDDVILSVTFGSMWEGLNKYVEWKNANGEPVVTLLLGTEHSHYNIPIPAGVKSYAGDVTVTFKGFELVGSAESASVLTVAGRFKVAESGFTGEYEEMQEPGVVEMLIDAINAVKTKAVDFITHGVAEYVEVKSFKDYTFSASTGLEELTIDIPEGIGHGFTAGVNFFTSAAGAVLNINSLSDYPLKVLVGGTIQPEGTVVCRPSANKYVQTLITCDGNIIVVQIVEM